MAIGYSGSNNAPPNEEEYMGRKILSAFASSSRRPIKCLRDMTWGEFKRECGIELGKSKQRSSIRIR